MMFYHYILNEDSESLIHKFYKLQAKKPVKNDWSLTIKENLESLKISLTEDKIQKLSIYTFQKIVKTAIQKTAFKYLINLKNSHSKVLHISYENLKMQDYLMPSIFSPDVAKFTFLCRSRMVQVGENFKQGRKTTICPICKITSEIDSQPLLMKCSKLNVNYVVYENVPKYQDLFSKSLQKKLIMVEILRKHFQERTKFLNKQ